VSSFLHSKKEMR